jgi:hypothetical protein
VLVVVGLGKGVAVGRVGVHPLVHVLGEHQTRRKDGP